MKNKFRSAVFLFLGLMTLGCVEEPAGASRSSEGLASSHAKGLTPVRVDVDKSLPPLLISKDAQARVAIVVPKSNYPYYQKIAEILKERLDAATGANFAIVKQLSTGQKGIFVGPCDFAPVMAIYDNLQKEKVETIGLKMIAEGLVLCGNDKTDQLKAGYAYLFRSRGTLFAMVEFLERLVGYRFYYTGELGTHTPDLRRGEFSIPAVDYMDCPVFDFRTGSYDGAYVSRDSKYIPLEAKDRWAYQAFRRLGDVAHSTIGHTDGYWHEFFAQKHPEYFAVRKDGTRMLGKGNHFSSQRCYANEGGLQAHIKAIDDYLKSGKNYKLFTRKRLAPNKDKIYWFPNDGYLGCYCKDCLAKTITVPDNNPHHPDSGRRHVGIVYDYAKRLALAIKKHWPEKKLVVPAYGTYRIVPKDMDLPDNIVIFPIYYGSYTEAFYKDAMVLKDAQDDIDANFKISGHRVPYWSHYPHAPRYHGKVDAPYMIPHILKKLLGDNRDRIAGVYLNGDNAFSYALDGVMLYLYYKLLWNPDLDVDACIMEYCDVMFGAGAEDMKQYFNLAIKRWENTKWKDVSREAYLSKKVDKKYYFVETYPRKIRMKLKSFIDQALKKTKVGTVYRRRMIHMSKGTASFFNQGDLFDRVKQTKGNAQGITPVIDGKLDEWSMEHQLMLVDNTTGLEAEVETTFLVGHDERYLYIAGVVKEVDNFDPEERFYKEFGKKDAISIYLCADQPGFLEAGFNVEDQFHQISFGAEGRVYDAYKSARARRPDGRVNLGVKLKVAREGGQGLAGAGGFTFELAIPYKGLNAVLPKPGITSWKVNFFRTHRREDKHKMYHSWGPTGGRFDDTTRFAELKFSKNR